MYNNYLCFTNFPKINELLCVFATILIPEKVNTSYYNLIIKKCRQLIFENSEVLASPNLDQIYGIYIIVKETYYETGELQKYLSNHNLKAGAPTVLSKYMYEDCCMYTTIAKLAPKWNIVSNYFIQGRDFLTNIGLKDCVRLSLCINDNGETSMIFEISRIRLPSMSLDKLDLPDNYLKELNENNSVSFKYNNSKTIRVLPSLKRGNILSINRNINKLSSLQNYHQFRRHWKNTYGYRLPEFEKDIFYLEISFFDGSPIFTYPSLCVRPYEPTFVQRVEPGPVVAGFIADFMRSMPKILGDKYPVPSHINQPEPRLFSGAENLQHSNICAIDIKSIPDSQSSAIIYLPTQKPNNSTNNEQEPKSKLSQLLSLLKKPENKSPIYLTQKTTLSQGISQTPQPTTAEERLDENDITNINRKPLSELNKPKKPSLISQEIQSQAQFLTEKVSQRSNMTPKKIPNFSKSTNSTTEIKQSTNDTKPTDKIVPVFTSKFPKIKKIKNIPDSVTKPLKPVQKELKSKEASDDDLTDFITDNMIINKKPITPMFKMGPNKSKEKKETLIKQKINNSELNRVNFENNSEAIEAKIPREKSVNNNGTLIKNVNNNNISMERKRVNSENNSEATVTKKPRERSAPTEINNMKELVNNGTLNKLNIQSLIKWLKERNVHCTTKDKKSILIEKVINNLSKQ